MFTLTASYMTPEEFIEECGKIEGLEPLNNKTFYRCPLQLSAKIGANTDALRELLDDVRKYEPKGFFEVRVDNPDIRFRRWNNESVALLFIESGSLAGYHVMFTTDR